MELGRMVVLPVLAVGDAGMVVGQRDDFAVVPPREVPEGAKRGDRVTVFVARDDVGNLRATLRRPKVEAGGFGVLRVVDVSEHGAHFDWGLDKDLLVPENKMHDQLWVGDEAVVAVAVDDRGRCFGSTWLGQYLNHDPQGYERGRQVSFLAYSRNEHGYLGVVDGRYSGMVPRDVVPHPEYARESRAWVLRITFEGRLDCTLTPTDSAGITSAADAVLAALEEAGGTLDLGDKSSPESIRHELSMSKKAFKRAIGRLYRDGRITMEPESITRIQSS
jgi:hypothetical protein